MKKEDIKVGDILANPKIGFCGYVVKIEKFVRLRDLDGKEMVFDADYLESAPSEQAAKFQGRIPAIIVEKTEEAAPRTRKAKTPEEINAGLAKFIADIAAEFPASAEHFKSFWNEVIEIIGKQQEGKKWDMRWKSVKHFSPVLKAPSTSTNEWVIGIYLLFGENARIEIIKTYLPEDYNYLFPIRNKMMDTTHALKMDWAKFNAGPRAEFLKLLKILNGKWQKDQSQP
jgi:hypothetical protein